MIKIKKFSEFIKESYRGNQYGLQVWFEKDGETFDKENLMLSSERECRSFIIGWLEKNPNCTVKYFEICNGDNFSDSNSLVVWGGKNGYFSNILDDDFPAQRSRVSSREIDKIKKCEVDIDSYLNIQ